MDLSMVFDTTNHEVLTVRLHAWKFKIIFLQKLFTSGLAETFESKEESYCAILHKTLYLDLVLNTFTIAAAESFLKYIFL